MTSERRRSAITLIELLAVSTLLAVSIGVTTLGVRGLSDRSRLASAARILAAAYRLAAADAARSGRPSSLRVSGSRCAVERPELHDGRVSWHAVAGWDFPRGVAVRFLGASEVTVNESEPSSDRVMVTPGRVQDRLSVILELPDGVQARAFLEANAGRIEFRFAENADDRP